MNLIIDLGNTKIKVAVFEHNTMTHRDIYTYDNWKNEIGKILKENKKIQNVVVANVSRVNNDEIQFVKAYANLFIVSTATQFPFLNKYETPQTLGIDRLVLATGAVLAYPNKNRLVIDAGTCVTYDFIDENDNYLGGGISPGIRLRYQSLHNYTAQLPLLSKEDYFELIGSSTTKSIHSGVINGLTNEVDGFINRYSDKYRNFIIILTGGDAEFLAMRLKNTIFANPNFLLESLNQTFQYNQHD
jgi:type III pantothenate kinase